MIEEKFMRPLHAEKCNIVDSLLEVTPAIKMQNHKIKISSLLL